MVNAERYVEVFGFGAYAHTDQCSSRCGHRHLPSSLFLYQLSVRGTVFSVKVVERANKSKQSYSHSFFSTKLSHS